MKWVNSVEEFQELFDKFIEKIELFKRDNSKKTVVFIGHMIAFDKGTCNYMAQLKKRLKDTRFFLINESIGVTDEKADLKVAFEHLTVPRTSASGQFESNLSFEVPEFIRKTIEEKDYLSEAVEILYMWHDNMGAGYAEWFVYYIYKIYLKVFECLEPKAVVYWNKFNVLHVILERMCDERDVKNIYWEHGSIPGTFALEREGQMGESYPATYVKEFNELKVSEEECREANELIRELKEEKANRNVQVKNEEGMKVLQGKIKVGRPIILYTGQNDFESGMIPYTEHTKEFHSPIFATSDEAAIFLKKLAEKNDWNLIYKPHPLMIKYSKCLTKESGNHLILVDNVDLNDLIDMADVTITILSQCGYAALLRDKPVVMLGRIQLVGKGCTYEALQEDDVEKQIQKAIDKGYVELQENNFVKHVAQMCKYYLYDSLTCVNKKIGKGIENAAELVANAIDSKKVDEVKSLVYVSNPLDVVIAVSLSEKYGTCDVIINCDVHEKILRILEKTGACLITLEEMTSDRYVEYSDIYFSKVALLKDKALMKNIFASYLDVHIIDNDEMTLYLKKDFRELVHKSLIKERVKEVLVVSRQLYVNTFGFNINELSKQINDQKCYEILERDNPITQKYIYIESLFFCQRIFTNEEDMVDLIYKKIGNTDFAVLCHSEESKQLYERKGYTAYVISKSEIECNLISSQEKKVFFTPYSSKYLFYTLLFGKSIYVNIHNLLVGKITFKKDKGFTDFFDITCNQKGWKNSVFVPKDEHELLEVILYVTGGVVGE